MKGFTSIKAMRQVQKRIQKQLVIKKDPVCHQRNLSEENWKKTGGKLEENRRQSGGKHFENSLKKFIKKQEQNGAKKKNVLVLEIQTK